MGLARLFIRLFPYICDSLITLCPSEARFLSNDFKLIISLAFLNFLHFDGI